MAEDGKKYMEKLAEKDCILYSNYMTFWKR